MKHPNEIVVDEDEYVYGDDLNHVAKRTYKKM